MINSPNIVYTLFACCRWNVILCARLTQQVFSSEVNMTTIEVPCVGYTTHGKAVQRITVMETGSKP